MTSAHRPTGRGLTVDEAMALAGRSRSTIYQWVHDKHVRMIAPEGDDLLAELDVIAMRDKRWTRKPRLRHTHI